jgi:hypothetical protein
LQKGSFNHINLANKPQADPRTPNKPLNNALAKKEKEKNKILALNKAKVG